MTLQSLLSKTVSVNSQTLTTVGGMRKKAFTTVKYAALPARIQPIKTNVMVWYQRDGIKVSHTIYIGSPGMQPLSAGAGITITQGEQILYGSRKFLVQGVRNIDEANVFLTVDCLEILA